MTVIATEKEPATKLTVAQAKKKIETFSKKGLFKYLNASWTEDLSGGCSTLSFPIFNAIFLAHSRQIGVTPLLLIGSVLT